MSLGTKSTYTKNPQQPTCLYLGQSWRLVGSSSHVIWVWKVWTECRVSWCVGPFCCRRQYDTGHLCGWVWSQDMTTVKDLHAFTQSVQQNSNYVTKARVWVTELNGESALWLRLLFLNSGQTPYNAKETYLLWRDYLETFGRLEFSRWLLTAGVKA